MVLRIFDCALCKIAVLDYFSLSEFVFYKISYLTL